MLEACPSVLIIAGSWSLSFALLCARNNTQGIKPVVSLLYLTMPQGTDVTSQHRAQTIHLHFPLAGDADNKHTHTHTGMPDLLETPQPRKTRASSMGWP